MNDDQTDRRGPAAFHTILFGGMAIGFLDMLDAFAFFGWYLDVGIQRVFQGVAAGVMGREAAVSGGWNTFALGLLLHYINAFLIATVFYLASRSLSILWRHPIISGILFGIACHFVMQCVVIPLSAIGGAPSFPLRTTLNGVIGHALLVGVPVALIARWSVNRQT